MKKYLFAVVCTLTAATVSADPTSHWATFSCPPINMVSNFGDYIAGFGSEFIVGENNPVYFKTILWPTGVPSNLSTYSNSATNYDKTTSQVTCSYMSSNPNNAAFDLVYYITNGIGGLITAQSNTTISLELLIGLSK